MMMKIISCFQKFLYVQMVPGWGADIEVEIIHILSSLKNTVFKNTSLLIICCVGKEHSLSVLVSVHIFIKRNSGNEINR